MAGLSSFDGALWVVADAPASTSTQGVATVRSLADIPAPLDLVVITDHGPSADRAAVQAAETGAAAVVMFGAGYGEHDGAGRRREAALRNELRARGCRLLGPNCAGFANLETGLHASMVPALATRRVPGRLGIVSQSGGVGAALLERADDDGLGVGFFVTTGNEIDVTWPEAVDFLVARPGIDVVAVFAEALADGRALVPALDRARRAGKPVVLFMAASTGPGRRAAHSHTGATVGGDDALRAVLREHDVVVVPRLDGLLDAAAALLRYGRQDRQRIAMLTQSGGAAIVLTDSLVTGGLSVDRFPQPLEDALRAAAPHLAQPSNPLDVSATESLTADTGLFERTLRILATSPHIDCVAPVLGPVDDVSVTRLIATITGIAAQTPIPVVSTFLGGKRAEQLRDAGGVAYADPAHTAQGILAVCRTTVRPKARCNVERYRDHHPTRAIDDRQLLTEQHAYRLLSEAGLPVVEHAVVRDDRDAVEAARRIGYPVVVKLLSPDIPHRSDVGAVATGLADDVALAEAVRRVLVVGARHTRPSRIEGVLLAGEAPGDIELFCGFMRDAAFGPIVSVGVGGRNLEILAEYSAHRAPVTHVQATALLASLCDGRLTSHRRGMSRRAQLDMADLIVRLGRLAVERPDITELDCNPIRVSADSVLVVDALAVIADTSGRTDGGRAAARDR